MRTQMIKALSLVSSLVAAHVALADGLIIPMYVDPAAPTAFIGRYSNPATGQLVHSGAKADGTYYTGMDLWGIVASNAVLIKKNKSGRFRDYFVIANGPSSGPFAIPFNNLVTTAFTKVRNQGGKIFGYVHTMATPTSQTFRSLSSVEADITTWAAGYAHMDGFFIDEFYPYYEVNGANPGFCPTNPNPGPNGQISPAGGYYATLTGWIRAHYPTAKIIVNPGGRVYSNQYTWNNLADVSCTFEDSLANASGDNAWYAPPGTPWGNLARESTYTTAPQAALIHTNTTDLAGAINNALAFGYKYVYAVEATPNYDNTWGIMPSYFTTEIQNMAAR